MAPPACGTAHWQTRRPETGGWPATSAALVPGYIKSDSGLHAVNATTGAVTPVTGAACE